MSERYILFPVTFIQVYKVYFKHVFTPLLSSPEGSFKGIFIVLYISMKLYLDSLEP